MGTFVSNSCLELQRVLTSVPQNRHSPEVYDPPGGAEEPGELQLTGSKVSSPSIHCTVLPLIIRVSVDRLKGKTVKDYPPPLLPMNFLPPLKRGTMNQVQG